MQKACKYQIDISTETLRLTEVVSIAKKAIIDTAATNQENKEG
jgi:hypothetical protein